MRARVRRIPSPERNPAHTPTRHSDSYASPRSHSVSDGLALADVPGCPLGLPSPTLALGSPELAGVLSDFPIGGGPAQQWKAGLYRD